MDNAHGPSGKKPPSHTLSNSAAAHIRRMRILEALRTGVLTSEDARYLLANPSLDISRFLPSRNAHGPAWYKGPDRLAGRDASHDAPWEFSFRTYGTYDSPADFSQTPRARIMLPVTPDKVEVSSKNGSSNVSTIAGFSFSHAGTLDLEQISFSSFFPAGLVGLSVDSLPSYVSPKIGSLDVPAYTPKQLCDIFTDAMGANQPVLFSVTRSGPVDTTDANSVIPEDTYTISSFNYSYQFGDDQDATYTMTLQRWIPQQVEFRTLPTTYTTRRYGKHHKTYHHGDKMDCAAIAQRLLGSSRRAQEIVKLNKAKIAADIKRRKKLKATKPHLIVKEFTPGIVLKIPAK